MSPSSATVPSVREGALGSRVGEDFVVLNPAGTRLRGLNPVGARIWELIDGRRTVEEIARGIAGDWDVPPEQAMADVLAFVALLASRELIDCRE